jgi:Ca2+-binding EF-hand superfamily protein
VLIFGLVCGLAAGRGPEKEGPSAPVLLLPGEKEAFRLRVEVNGDRPPSADWEAFLDRLFDHFDRDGDGWLTRAEASCIMPLPLPSPLQRGMELTIDFDKADADRNGKVSRAELKAYCRAQGFTPVVLVLAPPTAADATLAHLFLSRLDANGDGKLSAGELHRAPTALRKYDFNEDETLDLGELLPPSGDRKPGPSNLKVGGGTEKDAVLRIDLGAKTGASLRAKGSQESQFLALGEGSYRLRGPAGQWWLTFRAARAAPDMRSAGDFLIAQFEAVLGDKKTLSKTDLEEDATLAGFLDLLPYADRDGDGRLSLSELKTYLRLVEAGLRSQVWVTVSDRGRNPFHFLDRDGDGRLSHREQLSAIDLLGGKGEMVGLPQQVDLAFGGPLVKSWGGVAIPMARRPPTKPAVVTPPGWFRALDRNGDGFVSRAEFVGPPEVFRELDADGDGVISAAEAARAAGR